MDTNRAIQSKRTARGSKRLDFIFIKKRHCNVPVAKLGRCVYKTFYES